MHCKRQHATSGDVLWGAARRLTATKFRATDDDEACGSNAEKKILSRNLDNVNKIWHAVALVIESSLFSNAARGVRIESLGTFALDAKDRERFFLASEFVARHRLVKYDACTGGSLAGGSVNTRLNISRVAAVAGSPRPEAERVLDAVLRSLRQCLASGRSVTLSFHPVAEFSCAPSTRQSRMRYLPAFRARKKAVVAAATGARVGVGRAKSKPTPWAADPRKNADTDAAVAAAEIASTVGAVADSRVVVRSPVVEKFLETRTESDSVGIRRPLSASASPSKTNSIVSNRPHSSHGGGSNKVLQANPGSGADGSIAVRVAAESAVGAARTPRVPAWKSHRVNRHIENVGDLTTAYNSCASLGSGVFSGDPQSARCVRSSGRGANERMGVTATCRHCNGHGHLRQEEWLANLLHQQTLAQTGGEGLRRLKGLLTHANVRGRDGRLSGRTLLQALRDVGVKLTPGELTEMTSVFRQQRDGRVSQQVLLAAMECEVLPVPSVEKASGLSPDCVRGWREGGHGSGGSPCGIRRTRDGRVRGTPRQEGSPRPSRDQGGDALSTQDPSCNKSRAPQDAAELLARTTREGNEPQGRRGVDRQYRDGDSQDVFRSRLEEGRPSASQHDNIADKAMVLQVGVPAMSQLRRECWHYSGEDGSKGKASAEERAIAELATIVYSPPRSLEGLIHVLQASKVAEQPAIACAAMSARLCQLRPGLGRARAKQLAAAASCRRLDEKVCLVQLHALLERRFGRNGLSAAATATERNIPTRSTVSSSAGLSCAAMERVRRNFLSGKAGLGGLRAALSKASASAEGSLTKEELRRALTTAGGPGCPPPTAKDVDDLFTLFSCQTSAGVNGGRVEAATVLRSLRGDLSPPRESVVRDVFRSLLNLSRSGRGAHNGVGAPNGQGNDRFFSNPRTKVGTKRAMNDAVHVEDLKNAYCKGGGSGFSPVNDNTALSSDRGDRSMEGWFSVRARPGDETPRTSRSGGNGWGVGGKAANNGVTVEQFLEHYRDVSAGIDGDDAFEAFIRGSWSLHPLPHSGQSNYTIPVSERGRDNAVGAGGAGRKPPRVASVRHGDDDAARNRSPDWRTQSSSRNHGVLFFARTGGTAPGRHHSLPRESGMGKTVAVALPTGKAVVHHANRSGPAVSRAGEPRCSVSTPPKARLPGGSKRHMGTTNAGSVRERGEGSSAQPLSAARRCADGNYKEGGSARGGAAISEAMERRVVKDAHHRRRPVTHRGQWAPGGEKSGDGRDSCQDRRERAPQRQTQHEQGRVEERKGFRVEPVGDGFEQHQAGTASLGVTVIPATNADVSVCAQDQLPADITTARVNNLVCGVQAGARVAQELSNRAVQATTNNANRAGESNALVHGSGCNRSVPFDRSAAAVRVQQVYRGHKGRRRAGAEGRKRASRRASEREARMERERPHAASRRLAGRLPRPKLPSTYGF